MVARSLGIGVLLVALTGCGYYDLVDVYWCDHPDKGHKGPDGEPDPCHRRDADGGSELSCEAGEYVHWEVPWQAPTLLWLGLEDQAPECPLGPTTISFHGHAGLVAPSICEACTCEPPTGSCALPSTLIASTAMCGTPGATTSFNAPTPWDGSCDSTIKTPIGAAESLTIDPITMTENGCASGPPVAAKIVSLHWETYARGCDVGIPVGPIERSICVAAALPPGFDLCISQAGEHACPENEQGNGFTEQHVLYQGIQDNRQCSACTCGAPTGSTCKAQLSIYEGASCSASPLVSIQISSTKSPCFDIGLPGQSLGSKSAGPTTYLPGTCPPGGGDGSGIAIPTEPTTLCCRH